MNRGLFAGFSIGLVLLAAALALPAQQGAGTFQATLSGYQEVPTLWSPGSGDVSATPSDDASQIEYTLNYAGLTTPVQAAHLHLGTEGVNGGIIVFLCSNMPNPPANVPACPQMEGSVSGTLMAAGVVGPADQGIAPGEFEKLVDALNNGAVYANVHTEQFPAGEIRGQLSAPGAAGRERAGEQGQGEGPPTQSE